MKIKLLTTKRFVSLERQLLLFLLMITSINVWGQTTIASEGLNNASTLLTVAGGAYYTGNSATGDRPATSPFAIEGTHGYGVTNGTATLTSSNINTSSYSAVSATFRLASFSIGSTGNGADATDIVTVEVSPNGGTNWYSTARVLGNNNAYWAYSTGGVASTAYDGDSTPVDFTSAAGNALSGGYSTVTVTGLPSATTLRVRITLLNNATAERWIVDDFKVTGTPVATNPPVVTAGQGVTGTVNTVLTPYQILASNNPTSYAVATGTLPAGLTLATGTGIISGTPTAPGTSSVTVTATNNAGPSSAATLSFNIAKANQTITFAALDSKAYGDPNFTLSGSSSSNLTVTYVSSNTSVATVSGNTVTVVGVGNTNITASQAGDAIYNPATSVVRPLTVTTRPLTITGLTASNKIYNATNAAVVTGSPTLTNYLPADASDVVLTGTPVYTFVNATVGTGKAITTSGLSLTGSKASNYNLVLPSLSANITAKPLTVTGAVAQDKPYDGTMIATVTGAVLNGVESADTNNVNLAANGVFATANAGSGIAVSLSLTGNGITNYSLTQPGLTANITKALQTIDFTDVPVQVIPATSIDLNDYAYSTQGLVLTYASSNPSVASITGGSTLNFLTAGVVTITASQAGSNNYEAAESVTKVVSIIAAPLAIAANPITYTSFTANWQAVPGAAGYALDVYKKETGSGNVAGSAYYNFTTASPASVPDGVTISNVTQGNNNGTTSLLDNGSASSGYTGSSGGNNAGAAARVGALNTAASGSAYFQFTITPTSGSFTLTGISFGARSTGTGPQSYTLRSSIDGYTSDITNGTISNNSSWSLKTSPTLSFTQNQAVTFRIYGYGGSGGAQTNTANWRIDDLTLNLISQTTTIVPVYVLENQNVGDVTSYTVANLDQNTEYFYVVRALNGDAVTTDSNEIAVTTDSGIVWNGTAWSNGTGPTATEDAEVIGEYHLNQSFEVKNLTIVGDGLLAIQNNQDVTVHGNVVLFDDNKLVLESDANLVQKTTGADTNPTNHTVLVKRNGLMPTLGYTYWSSPVMGQNLYSFSNGYNQAGGGTGDGTPWNRFYVYNEATDYFVTRITGEITLDSSSTFETGRGYAIKGMNSFGNVGYPTHEFSFTGKMNNGQVFSQLLKNSCTVETGCEKGYNLVGNPYPSSIDFEALYAANSSKIYGTAYFWTNSNVDVVQQQAAGYSGNNYAIYNLSGGTGAVDPDPSQGNGSEVPNGIIKLGQGFIVKAKVAGRGQALEFNNDIRLGYDPNAIFYNSRKADKNRFWLTLTSAANVANTILVAYIPEATNDFEINYDGELFVIGSDSFYSILGSKKLAIQGKADFNADDKVALGNVYSKNGEYKISIKDKEGIFKSGQSIYLKDKVLNRVVNLSQGDYVFQGVKGTDATRFEIVYKEDAVLATDNASKSGFSVYKDGNSYVVASSKKLGKVEVYDTAGRLMTALSTNETTIRIDASAFSSGVYILKVENSGDVKTKKVIK